MVDDNLSNNYLVFPLWLEELGFTANPFAQRVAEEESNLPRYFVLEEKFKHYLEQPVYNCPKFIFAGRGCGKSAIGIMLKYLLTETDQYPLAIVVNFNVTVFKKLLVLAGNSPANLTRSLYHAKLRELIVDAYRVQKARIEKASGKGPLQLTETGSLEEIAYQLNQQGVQAIHILIDGVDELEATLMDFNRSADLITPLASDHALLKTPHFHFWFLLPNEICGILHQRQIRFDRYEILRWNWTPAELGKLLTFRLKYFTRPDLQQHERSLGQIISDVPEIDVRMSRDVGGSPRNLLKLGGYLLESYKQEIEAVRYNTGDFEFKEAGERAYQRATRRLERDLVDLSQYGSFEGQIFAELSRPDYILLRGILSGSFSLQELKDLAEDIAHPYSQFRHQTVMELTLDLTVYCWNNSKLGELIDEAMKVRPNNDTLKQLKSRLKIKA